jgi:hypothetical protein
VRDEIYDESQEIFEDPYGYEDKDETLSEVQQEESSKKPVHQRMAMSDKKMQVHLETSRSKHEAAVLRNDSLRRKYDIRYQKIKKNIV